MRFLPSARYPRLFSSNTLLNVPGRPIALPDMTTFPPFLGGVVVPNPVRSTSSLGPPEPEPAGSLSNSFPMNSLKRSRFSLRKVDTSTPATAAGFSVLSERRSVEGAPSSDGAPASSMLTKGSNASMKSFWKKVSSSGSGILRSKPRDQREPTISLKVCMPPFLGWFEVMGNTLPFFTSSSRRLYANDVRALLGPTSTKVLHPSAYALSISPIHSTEWATCSLSRSSTCSLISSGFPSMG